MYTVSSEVEQHVYRFCFLLPEAWRMMARSSICWPSAMAVSRERSPLEVSQDTKSKERNVWAGKTDELAKTVSPDDGDCM